MLQRQYARPMSCAQARDRENAIRYISRNRIITSGNVYVAKALDGNCRTSTISNGAICVDNTSYYNSNKEYKYKA